MNLTSKLEREKALTETLKETKELNSLMRDYLRVAMDKESAHHFERKTEINIIYAELETIKKQLAEIAVHTPSKELRTLAKAYNNKGISLDSLGHYEKAIECYDKALKFNPDDNNAVLNKGVALDQMGSHEEAIEHYDQIISNLEPLTEEDFEYLEEIPKLDLDNLEIKIPLG